jgi:hypothetical protein
MEATSMRGPGVDEEGYQGSPLRPDQVAEVVVRSVDADMSRRPAERVYRALNARLHADGVALDTEKVREYADADSTSDGTRIEGTGA